MEAVIAAGIFAMVFAGLYAVSDRAKRLVSQGELAADVQRNCLGRIEQLRSYGWAKVSSPSAIATMLATPTTSSTTFTKEVVTVYLVDLPQTTPLPTPAPTTTAVSTTPLFTVTKDGTNAPVISPAGFDPNTSVVQRALNFRVYTQTVGTTQSYERELSTVIAKSASR